MTGRTMAPICRTLGIGRSSAYRDSQPRGARYTRRDDAAVTAQVRAIIRTRASYGARRGRALVNREFDTTYNLTRIQRVLELTGWKLPRSTRRRTGRAHTGQLRRAVSNERWCSDGFEIACWNGEIVPVAFALDCHDRECVAVVAVPRTLAGRDIQQLMQHAVAARYGEGARPDVPIQWLSDNGEHVHGARHDLHRGATQPRPDHAARGQSAVKRHGRGLCEHAPARLPRRRRSGGGGGRARADRGLARRLHRRRSPLGSRVSVAEAVPHHHQPWKPEGLTKVSHQPGLTAAAGKAHISTNSRGETRTRDPGIVSSIVVPARKVSFE